MTKASDLVRSEDLYPTRDGRSTRCFERADPVVHAPQLRGPLDELQVARYQRDGFLVLPSLLSAGEVAELRVGLETIRRTERGGVEAGVIRERGGDAVRSVFAVHERPDVFGALARHATLVGAARQILDDEIYVHQSRVNFKPALVGKSFGWHSDFETWHAEDGMPRMRALSASVLLDPNHAWNGPLMLLPGSHRTFVSCPTPTPPDNHRLSLVDQQIGTPSSDALCALFDDVSRIDLALGPEGTVVLFDCNTMHASSSNLSPLPRSNVFLVYNALSNRLVAPFAAPAPRPAFLATREPVPITS
ncbi:MAG: phytanoyl-CoA dioxygenase family protein [Myxococcota bacterium]|nr:phytanoyl-CoA dioxygenase family protein [Myxococcota bacterium]